MASNHQRLNSDEAHAVQIDQVLLQWLAKVPASDPPPPSWRSIAADTGLSRDDVLTAMDRLSLLPLRGHPDQAY
jgi:hypothetical protein